MSNSGSSTVTSINELAEFYARPIERSVKIVLDHVDATGRAFIAASPFLFSQLEAEKVSIARRRATSRAL